MSLPQLNHIPQPFRGAVIAAALKHPKWVMATEAQIETLMQRWERGGLAQDEGELDLFAFFFAASKLMKRS